MVQDKALNVVFIECTDNYPNKFTANNSKVRLIADGLKQDGVRVSFVNRLYGFKGSSLKRKTVANVYGIDVWSLPRFSKRKLSILSNFWDHYHIVKDLYRKGENNILLMGGPVFPFFLFYAIVYRLMGFHTGVIITEWTKDIPGYSNIKRLDNWLFAKFFGYFVNMIFPISNFLMDECKKFRTPMFKIPILASFPEMHKTRIGEKYFLLCSTLSYFRNIEIVIESFDEFRKRGKYDDFKLKLVLSGSSVQMDRMQDYLLNHKGLSIEIYHQIPYSHLLDLYQNASGLLIPLENTNQDKARFSQKIAEYLSTGRPIITNAVGDISYYFHKSVDAYLAERYDMQDYAEIMQAIADNPEEADRIGHNGFLLGKKYFDNISVCKQLVGFLMQFS